MENEIIKRHDFENRKNEIKKFVDNKLVLGSRPSIKLVNEHNWVFVKWSSTHNITGPELAEQMCFVHDRFIDLYKNYNDVIDMFSRIYDALEALDKDYINGILSSIKSADEASRQAIDASNLAREIGETAQAIGTDARNLGQELKKVVMVLEKHDKELQKSKHIQDVDELWEKVNNLDSRTESSIRSCKANEEKIKNIIDDSAILFEREKRLQNIKHLEEIDSLWDGVQGLEYIARNQKTQIDMLRGQCADVAEKVNVLCEWREEFEKEQEKRWKYTKIGAILIVGLWIVSVAFVVDKVGL